MLNLIHNYFQQSFTEKSSLFLLLLGVPGVHGFSLVPGVVFGEDRFLGVFPPTLDLGVLYEVRQAYIIQVPYSAFKLTLFPFDSV